MLPLLPRPPPTQDEIAVWLPRRSLAPLSFSAPADDVTATAVLNLRVQRKGLRGMEKVRRIFLAAFVVLVSAAVVVVFVAGSVVVTPAATIAPVVAVAVVVKWVVAASPSLCSLRSFVVPMLFLLSLSRSLAHTKHSQISVTYKLVLTYELHGRGTYCTT